MKKLAVIIVSLATVMPFAGAMDTEQVNTGNIGHQFNTMNLNIDHETTALLKQLERSMADLQTDYEKASANRGITIEGASPLAQERFQLEQDSICMDIRSTMLDIKLQIDEIKNK